MSQHKICAACPRTAPRGERFCASCRVGKQEWRKGWQKKRAKVLTEEAVCGICGKGARIGDPWVVDHIYPRRNGGSSERHNLRKAHRSCNTQKG